jgi:hypothetical protein
LVEDTQPRNTFNDQEMILIDANGKEEQLTSSTTPNGSAIEDPTLSKKPDVRVTFFGQA